MPDKREEIIEAMAKSLMEHASCDDWQIFRHDAEAALDAALEQMMEPDDAMVEAGQHVNSEWLNDNAPIGESLYREPARAVFKTMIATLARNLTHD